MSLLQMSFSGGILILVILILRGIFLHKLPRRTFLALWWVALWRLLLPVAVPSAFSAYSLIHAGLSASETRETEKIQPGQPLPAIPIVQNGSVGSAEGNNVMPDTEGRSTGDIASVRTSGAALFINVITNKNICSIIYFTGTVLLAVFFAVSYLKCRMEFRTSLPAGEPFFADWLKAHPSKRPISIRRYDRITAPLTYGILRPVILLPGRSQDSDTAQLEYVLLHEYIHIRRLDAMTKLLIVLALCAHWFNPFAWAMYFLFNRDLELACDEQVVRQLGMDSRAPYALTLIGMEEKKRSLMPLCNGFGRNAIEERIKSIMKIKKTSLCAMGMAVMLVAGVTVTFATTFPP